jgi:methionyl-tRNA formyltransferase
VNLHFSLLPFYRGAAPIEWALLRGEERTGVTTILMNEGMDTGDILLQREVPIRRQETAGELELRLSEIGASLLTDTVVGLKNDSIRPLPQAEEMATYTKPLKKEDGLVSWLKSAVEIERMVRAFNPWPSAWCRLRGSRLKIHRASAVDLLLQSPHEMQPGSIVEVNAHEMIVLTGKQGLSLVEVQLENRKRLGIREFLKGYRIQRGEVLE